MLKDPNVDDRRERIRVAIYTQKLAHMPFRDGTMTYAQGVRSMLWAAAGNAAHCQTRTQIRILNCD